MNIRKVNGPRIHFFFFQISNNKEYMFLKLKVTFLENKKTVNNSMFIINQYRITFYEIWCILLALIQLIIYINNIKMKQTTILVQRQNSFLLRTKHSNVFTKFEKHYKKFKIFWLNTFFQVNHVFKLLIKEVDN